MLSFFSENLSSIVADAPVKYYFVDDNGQKRFLSKKEAKNHYGLESIDGLIEVCEDHYIPVNIKSNALLMDGGVQSNSMKKAIIDYKNISDKSNKITCVLIQSLDSSSSTYQCAYKYKNVIFASSPIDVYNFILKNVKNINKNQLFKFE